MPMIWFQESGYLDGPILSTFHTNLVVLPAVMEFMQYGFIALGVATIIIASLMHHKFKRPRTNVTMTSEGLDNPGVKLPAPKKSINDYQSNFK
ncbi:hypothetical protein KUCAC02_037694 [Chaenocephalus aceratus]|nr:hypothetical protein KUCAC02_037694 [Chaenocephalus aceratus]